MLFEKYNYKAIAQGTLWSLSFLICDFSSYVNPFDHTAKEF